MNITKDDKWVAVSCIQKSIRRGYADLAQKYSEALWNVEPSYLLYRLSIIAVEDIGLADIDLIEPFIATEIKKQNITDLGGLNYILGIVEKLANTNKDRSACDLGHLAKYARPENEYLKYLEKTERNTLNDLTQTSLAMWNLCGTKKFKNQHFETDANLEKLFTIFNPSSKVRSIVEHANNFQREPIAYNLLLLEKIFDAEKNQTQGKWKTGDVVIKPFTQTLISEWLLEGVDKHTSIGGRALEKLLTQSSKIQASLKSLPKNEWLDYLGYVQFRSDCEHVDKRLFYPTATKIFQGCREHNQEIFKEVAIAYASEKNELKKILINMFNYQNSKKLKYNL